MPTPVPSLRPSRWLPRPSLLLAGLAALCCCPAAAQAPDAAAPVQLPALMARLAAVPERRATFREEKRLAALSEPLLSTGTMLYRRPTDLKPGHLEKLTTWPQPESLVVDGDRLVITAGNEAPRVVDMGSVPELRALVDALRAPLAGDLAALQRSFQVAATGTAASWRIELTPRDARTAKLVRAVRIAGSGTDPRDILVVGGEGDEQRLLIEPQP